MRRCHVPSVLRPGRAALLSLAVLLFALASPASAQEADYEAARGHFERAQSLFDAGNFALAADGFEQAYDLMEGHPNRHLVLFNLARCLDESGAAQPALQRYREYLEAEGAVGAQLATARERIQELERRIALTGGTQTEPEPEAPVEASGGDDTLVVAGAAVLGGAAAGFVSMGIFGGLALAEDSSLSEGCGATASCSEADVADADTFALVSDISLGVAGAAAIAGAVLLIIGATSSSESAESAAVVPWVAPNGAGVVAHVAF